MALTTVLPDCSENQMAANPQPTYTTLPSLFRSQQVVPATNLFRNITKKTPPRRRGFSLSAACLGGLATAGSNQTDETKAEQGKAGRFGNVVTTLVINKVVKAWPETICCKEGYLMDVLNSVGVREP